MSKRGPAPTFNKAVSRSICDLIGDGSSLNSACAQLGIPRRTVRGWLVKYEDFSREVTAAQQMAWDSLAEEIVDIVDAADGSSQSEVTKARAQADMRRWLLSKVRPAQYGDRVQLAGDPESPLIPPEQVDTTKLSLMILAILGEAKPQAPKTIDAPDAAEGWRSALPKPGPAPTAVLVDDAPSFFGYGTKVPAEPADTFPGYVQPSLASAAQQVEPPSPALLREERRIVLRRAGREFDVQSGRVVRFRGDS
jgi:hypothetical protein